MYCASQLRVGMAMCVCHHQTNLQQTATCVCACNGSTPGSAIKESTPRRVCVCVCAHVRSRVGIGVCMCVCVCPASSLSHQQLLVCVCVYMYANTAEQLRLHKAVIILLIMKYFVLKIVSYCRTTTPCNLLSSPLKENHSRDTLTNCVSNSKG